MKLRSFLPTLLCLAALPAVASAAYIWVEGENPVKSTMNRHPWWYDKVKKDVLSGGDWISNWDEKKEGTAEYAIEAPESGDYTFWVRANPLGSLAYALDGAAWTPINLQRDKRGEQNIAADNKTDLRFIAWEKVGKIALSKGSHTMAFKISGGNSNSGALDCFVLTTDPFIPQGVLKPGDTTAGASDTPADPKDAIWIEGENPSHANVTRHPWWYDHVKKDALSGGDWISNYSDQKEGLAEYDFNVLTPDTYTFWVRANPSAGAELSWQLDKADWVPINFKDLRGEQNIAEDNKPDMRFIAWVKAGNVKLDAGSHTVRFEFGGTPQNHFHGGLDCFVFTRIPFTPAGATKPTVAKTSNGPGDWFPLLVDEDTFSPESVIDMSKLIPAPAGRFGFVHAAGKDLKFDGAPAPKFWGCGANLDYGRYTHEDLTQRAKYLRKFGVNIVREHPLFDDISTDGKIDPKKFDAYDWWFAELKKNGIYSDWSVFYHYTISPNDGYPPELYVELEGKPEHKDTYGIITIDAKLWEIRTRTLLQILTHKNPYTGLRYVDDPALAAVEMQNEDSVFFWNPLGWLAEGKKMPLHSKMLREMWAAWVKKKYPSDDALKTAWGQLKNGDSVRAAELQIMGPWELPGNGPRGGFAGEDRRAGDYIEFLAEMQRDFFQQCEKAMRGAGLKCLTMTTAWQVGGAATDAANIWTDTVGSMIDRHNYSGGGAGVHSVTEGKVNNQSHLAHPGSGIFSVAMKQVETKPFSISEWTQSPPNQWKVECAPIMAFYAMGLQGWDMSTHFIQSGTRLADGWGGSSYVTDTPAYLGQFPALAFALYHGHITESPTVAARRLSVADLFSGRDPLKQDATSGGYDSKTLISTGGTPPEAFAIGRITVDFSGGAPAQADFTKYWNDAGKVIESATGELTWDYGKEVITVHTPKTQAVIGRAGGQTFRLPGVTASFKTPFVSVIFTPLDDLPLVESKHILITALAQDKQTGARYNADGSVLESAGTAPLLLEPVQATLLFGGAKPVRVRALDHYGVPNGKTVPVAVDGSIAIDGTYRAYYYDVIR